MIEGVFEHVVAELLVVVVVLLYRFDQFLLYLNLSVHGAHLGAPRNARLTELRWTRQERLSGDGRPVDIRYCVRNRR